MPSFLQATKLTDKNSPRLLDAVKPLSSISYNPMLTFVWFLFRLKDGIEFITI
jgi:hypothetical protein